MENRFAGAKDLGDRRRRRLAGDDFGASEEPDQTQLSSPIRIQAGATADEIQLLRRLISPRLWKHTLLLATLVALLTIGLWMQTRSPIFNVADDNNGFTRGVCGILLLPGAQLAVLIGWLRSRSDIDFQGRYRWWKWLAAGMALTGILLLTDQMHSVPRLVSTVLQPFTGEISAARYAVVLVPALAGFAVVLARILPDMSRCVWSQSLLVVSVLSLVTRLLLTYGSASVTIAESTLSILTVLSAFCAFAAMLLHCRFVAFVCHDPPEQRV